MTLRLVLFGKQGAGKGTQAKRLSSHYGVPHISTGDVFRAEIASGSELGYRVKSIIEEGGLVSDELTNEVVKERLSQSDVADGFLLDGYPRTQTQVDGLSMMLAPDDVDLIVNLDIPTDVAIERLSSRRVCRNCGAIYGANHMPRNPLVCDVCGGEVIQRDDDKPEAIRQRLSVYESQSQPLLEYYDAKNKVVTVDALGEPDDVFNRLIAAIDDAVAAESA